MLLYFSNRPWAHTSQLTEKRIKLWTAAARPKQGDWPERLEGTSLEAPPAEDKDGDGPLPEKFGNQSPQELKSHMLRTLSIILESYLLS